MSDINDASSMIKRSLSLCLVLLFLTPMLSGCFSNGTSEIEVENSHWLPDVEDRSDLQYRDDDVFSRVSSNGSYQIGQVKSIYVAVPTITSSDGGAGITGDAEVHLGLWLPVIEGCDYDSAEILEDCQVPIIAEIGPYYNDGDVDALTPADRLGRFLIENFVPHGFGIAQVSVFGTGESNHCMDLMGTDEQLSLIHISEPTRPY